ncbi:MAG: SGNH/GDSL hydrolase family protein [Lentisphaerae bacterium]|nr:SGNH/GDSL hydrolase family protein [Lentisphaerota bacterium]
MKTSVGAATALLCTALNAGSADLPGRTFDKLTYNGMQISAGRALTDDEISALAGQQKILCMIGDSVSWAEDGDHFRNELLKLMPDLAFAGTHTAALGYSHAAEGGDSTIRVLNRLNDPQRVPDAPYYHLLIGINDCSAAKNDEQSADVAAGIADRIEKIVNILLARPGTRKVFLGALLPSPFDMQSGGSTVRERTGSVTNAILRKSFAERFPDGRVVWIEYEKPLHQNLSEWKKPENLRGAHPTAQGYKQVAAIAAPVLRKHMEPTLLNGTGHGVETVNLWDAKLNLTPPLIPGWYTLSLELENCDQVVFTLYSDASDLKQQFQKSYTLSGPAGQRLEVNFMTGYQNYGYTLAPFKIKIHSGGMKNVQIEKMRPLQHASIYGQGTFVDTTSPIAAGEIIVNAPGLAAGSKYR